MKIDKFSSNVNNNTGNAFNKLLVLLVLNCFSLLSGSAFAANVTGINGFLAVTQPNPPGLLKPSSVSRFQVQGSSATLLVNGNWLILGGQDSVKHAIDNAWRVNSKAAKAKLKTGLSVARAYHSATLLPDGRVIVFGGIGKTGQLLTDAELFDPKHQRGQTPLIKPP